MNEMRLEVLLLALFQTGLAAATASSQKPLALDTEARNVGSRLFETMEDDMKVSASAAVMLRGSVMVGKSDLALEAKGGSDSGPATLAEYCAGASAEEKKKGEFGVGTRVEANWEEYGTMYPGKIKEKNDDGTVDIAYDDGFTEKNVEKDDFKKEKKEKSLLQAKVRESPANDPACKLQKFLAKLQEQLKKMKEMVSQWSAAQRAQMSKNSLPPPPKVAAAPSSAPRGAAPATSDDLNALKQQLEERDNYIQELEKQAAANSQELQEARPAAAPAAAPGIATVDDLIAQYKAKIAQSDARIEELLQQIQEQDQKFARLGASQLTLQDIDAALAALEKDAEEARKKRDELKKDGSLDPELNAVIDSILKALEKMSNKVDDLIALEAKAKADEERAARDAEEFEKAARKKAEEEGRDADEAAAEAAAFSKKRADEKARGANLEAMKAAGEVEKDLKEAQEGATKLDTGLHPHGAKWWRYRYEHSYIESLIMIFICFLMCGWSEVIRLLKNNIKEWAKPTGAAAKSHSEELEEESHGTVYVLWLHIFAEQMMVCLLCFLTVWLIANTQLADVFPLIIKPSDDMHVPHTADEYRRLALDICTIFFFSIVFYFCLMFPVAHQTRKMTANLESFENDFGATDDQRGPAHLGCVASTSDDFVVLRRHFISYMQLEMRGSEDPQRKEIDRLMDGDMNEFPLWMYLKINVRKTVARFFKFNIQMWLPVIGLFLVFMLCHRFAHMGYVRIMGFFTLVMLGVIVGISWFTKSVAKEIQKGEPDTERLQHKGKSIHEMYNTESLALSALQFVMFVVCYGVARMICQPWMWELHFWPVLSLTILALFSAFLFVWLVAPAIPSFCAAMAVPPYVDDYNLGIMQTVAESVERQNRQSGRKVRKITRSQSTVKSLVNP